MRGIVFPVWSDLKNPTGDSDLGSKLGGASAETLTSTGNSSSHDSSKNGECDNCDSANCDCAPRFSYSVSYFNWCVSEPSSEDEECQQVTVSFNRMKIRKSSRERRENLKQTSA